jgi:predicted MFS family arabinose efflux permease
MAGSLTGGRLVDRLGRRGLAVISSFGTGALIAAYLNIGTPAISAALLFAGCVVSSMRYTAAESLTLEQVPGLKGTVMSLNSIALSVGVAVGTGLGGLLLLSYGYGGLGFMGLFSVAASVLYRFSVMDPIHS